MNIILVGVPGVDTPMTKLNGKTDAYLVVS